MSSLFSAMDFGRKSQANRGGHLTILVMTAAISQALTKARQGAKCFNKLVLSCVLLTLLCEVRSIIPVL